MNFQRAGLRQAVQRCSGNRPLAAERRACAAPVEKFRQPNAVRYYSCDVFIIIHSRGSPSFIREEFRAADDQKPGYGPHKKFTS